MCWTTSLRGGLPFWALSITFIASWWGAGSVLSTADLAYTCLLYTSLLLDGIGKIPLAFLAAKAGTPDTLALILSAVLPVVLGALIVINPFQTVQLVVRIFGLGLIADGIIDFAVVLTARRSQAG